MDEIIGQDRINDIVITSVMLNHAKNIALLRGFQIDDTNAKKYMRNVVIMIDNEFITDNISDSILLKEELNLFDKGDDQNKFCKLVSRKINSKNVVSLEIELKDNRKIYISKSEAKSIVTLWNMAMMGYSFARILEFENQQTLESWTNALDYNGYLDK